MTLVTAGRVGKPHGLDGSFYVDGAVHPLALGHGRVERVLDGPSCSVLELEDGSLVPFVSVAIRSVEGDEIQLNEDFLG